MECMSLAGLLFIADIGFISKIVWPLGFAALSGSLSRGGLISGTW